MSYMGYSCKQSHSGTHRKNSFQIHSIIFSAQHHPPQHHSSTTSLGTLLDGFIL